MSKFQALLSILFLVLVAPSFGGRTLDEEPSIWISGQGLVLNKLTIGDLRKMAHIVVSLPEKNGGQTSYSGVAMIDLLRRWHVVSGEHVSGKALTTYVLAEAKDGYKVVFGLGELDPVVTGRTIILADQANGRPLGEKTGPFRIIVEDDKKQARSIKMVISLRIVKLR